MTATLELVAARIVSPRVLIAGSGPTHGDHPGAAWTAEWKRQGYQVTNLDIDPRNEPDIVASMTDLGKIGSYEVVYCCHALEHLYPHEVSTALREFYRVLSPSGLLMVMVPDLEDVRPTEEILDIPLCGPITGLHLFYGDAQLIEQYPHMAHHSGFVKETLAGALSAAGFANVHAKRLTHYNLVATGEKL